MGSKKEILEKTKNQAVTYSIMLNLPTIIKEKELFER